ncbi:uncharacterized protein B0H18DRAFT_1120582 [Fomitopsis serialis]|uniref:uncharacterized protein n=1 Tax=Fomitopsis serialis TaxID=139415 RepID=UPI002008393B|nr:uncharacterized protein B0H18DRAFT_1120582 [Neoantrodia serialis]KAH9923055.1 hypothetical protein B0H18DRAFT_1120582 [Neoantrodia serialis]
MSSGGHGTQGGGHGNAASASALPRVLTTAGVRNRGRQDDEPGTWFIEGRSTSKDTTDRRPASKAGEGRAAVEIGAQKDLPARGALFVAELSRGEGGLRGGARGDKADGRGYYEADHTRTRPSPTGTRRRCRRLGMLQMARAGRDELESIAECVGGARIGFTDTTVSMVLQDGGKPLIGTEIPCTLMRELQNAAETTMSASETLW